MDTTQTDVTPAPPVVARADLLPVVERARLDETSIDDLPPDKVKRTSWGLESGRQRYTATEILA